MDKYYRKNEIINGYTIVNLIGQGRYGIVYLGENENSQKCVIKQLKNEMIEKSRSKLFYEEEILRKINNPAFPKFIGRFKDDYREGYILEYIQGPVFEDIVVRDNCFFTKEDIYKVGGQLLDIIEILHEYNIVHRDIRLPNVILKQNGELALIDFGLARYMNDKKYKKEIDYWFLGDFLIHLYYTTYEPIDSIERPWYEELNLTKDECAFLKKLMGIEESYKSIEEIRIDLENLKIKNTN
ncbi:protein kinase family protein [Paraclostridium ghonii]|uniref:serine/threonine-protein kinase n=1 Tax=Paraclostridium ghonii TaxID=29358 RepID=UPI00202CC85E|nr:protein kinase family protein [Paeniclostridium ghonii]MCM0167736.1 protein kinase family protein [Paeniclostridium ghonii]